VTITDSIGQALPAAETPSADTLRLYGDAFFVAMRSPRHAHLPLAALREALEPPLLLGQVHVFRFDGIPRGFFTWALFSAEAERRYIRGGSLTAGNWRSGDRLWIVDLVAPYRRLTAGMVRWVMTPGKFTDRAFHFRRVTAGNRTRKIVSIRLDRPDDKADVMTEETFLARQTT
jgi:cytolysin-activating lysine-acyltransferase